MPQIDTSTKLPPRFLTDPAEPNDKVIWKQTYAIYLNTTNKIP